MSPTHSTNKQLASRSTQGCWTCRLRKKKCDENHPSCFRCTSLQIACDGYGPRPYWMDRGDLQREQARYKKHIIAQIKSAMRGENSAGTDISSQNVQQRHHDVESLVVRQATMSAAAASPHHHHHPPTSHPTSSTTTTREALLQSGRLITPPERRNNIIINNNNNDNNSLHLLGGRETGDLHSSASSESTLWSEALNKTADFSSAAHLLCDPSQALRMPPNLYNHSSSSTAPSSAPQTLILPIAEDGSHARQLQRQRLYLQIPFRR